MRTVSQLLLGWVVLSVIVTPLLGKLIKRAAEEVAVAPAPAGTPRAAQTIAVIGATGVAVAVLAAGLPEALKQGAPPPGALADGGRRDRTPPSPPGGPTAPDGSAASATATAGPDRPEPDAVVEADERVDADAVVEAEAPVSPLPAEAASMAAAMALPAPQAVEPADPALGELRATAVRSIVLVPQASTQQVEVARPVRTSSSKARKPSGAGRLARDRSLTTRVVEPVPTRRGEVQPPSRDRASEAQPPAKKLKAG